MKANEESRRRGAAHTVRQELKGILVFLGVIWAAFVLDHFVEISQYGLRPRTIPGLVGIVTMPFLHKDIGHLISKHRAAFCAAGLASGQPCAFVGHRGVDGLAGRRFAVGLQPPGRRSSQGAYRRQRTGLWAGDILDRRGVPGATPRLSLIVAVVVLLFFGASILTGILPKPGVSWDGHLYGALAGGLLAYNARRRSA